MENMYVCMSLMELPVISYTMNMVAPRLNSRTYYMQSVMHFTAFSSYHVC